MSLALGYFLHIFTVEVVGSNPSNVFEHENKLMGFEPVTSKLQPLNSYCKGSGFESKLSQKKLPIMGFEPGTSKLKPLSFKTMFLNMKTN